MKSGLKKVRVNEYGWKTIASIDEEAAGDLTGEMEEQKEQHVALKRKRSGLGGNQGSTGTVL